MAARSICIDKSFEVGLPEAMGSAMPPNGAHVPVEIPSTPPGLAALFRACRDIYPDQPNPLQVTAVVKYWLGGPDPLDYISMYSNPGDPLTDCAPHWHYISFGMSDLHGDGRVHARNFGEDACDKPSGFGFELSFRLKCSESDVAPPTWPAAIMQALARYVFKFRNLFCVGDHISWHCPIDGSDTKLQHFLLAEDPQLGTVRTPYGTVQFLQLVGITQDELEAVQHWNGPEMLSIIRRIIGCGGDWLVTTPRRNSIFETDPSTRGDVDSGIVRDGSNLSGVSAQCCWCEMDLPTLSRCSVAASSSVTMASIGATGDTEAPSGQPLCGMDALAGSMSSMMISQDAEGARGAVGMRSISLQESEQIKSILRKGLSSSASVDASKKNGKVSSVELLGRSATGQSVGEFIGGNLESTAKSLELIHSKYLEGVHLCFNFEAGSLLPLAIRGRVMHGRHFTFQGMPVEHDDSTVIGGNVITFVSEKVKGTWASRSHPYAARGTWLHVCLPPALAQKMFEDVNAVVSMSREQRILPRTLEWPEDKITVTLLPDER